MKTGSRMFALFAMLVLSCAQARADLIKCTQTDGANFITIERQGYVTYGRDEQVLSPGQAKIRSCDPNYGFQFGDCMIVVIPNHLELKIEPLTGTKLTGAKYSVSVLVPWHYEKYGDKICTLVRGD